MKRFRVMAAALCAAVLLCGFMDKKHEQDFADLEVKRLCGVFGTPIPALPPERDKALDKVKEPPRTSRSLEREER